MYLLNTEGNSKQEDACRRTPVMRTEGKKLIIFPSEFHSDAWPQQFPELFSSLLSSFPSQLWSFSLFDSISEFPRENIVWRDEASQPGRLEKLAEVPTPWPGRRKKKKRKGEDRNRWEQDEKGQNKEGRQRPELRRGGRVSDAWKPRAEQGALLGLQGKPYRSPLGRRDFPRLLPWEEVQGSSSVFRALKVSGIVFQERKTWSWFKADWDGWCGQYWSSSWLQGERACMLMLYFPVLEYWHDLMTS